MRTELGLPRAPRSSRSRLVTKSAVCPAAPAELPPNDRLAGQVWVALSSVMILGVETTNDRSLPASTSSEHHASRARSGLLRSGLDRGLWYRFRRWEDRSRVIEEGARDPLKLSTDEGSALQVGTLKTGVSEVYSVQASSCETRTGEVRTR
jgi:hypothetical protein